ncbi:MAG: glycosyltransferase family 2 protein [Chitinophagaceae bacterium]|nr:MAG: glycosyltransferase family 2 protein [Chitinophagaceae bacterium]
MPDMPLVSVIIPTYNQKEKFLRECIESAMAQTYTNIRIVISDNHSTNNAPLIMAEYAARDERIQIIKPPHFLKIDESFLFAISSVQTKFACFVSSDDILMPNCIDELLKGMLLNEQAAFGHGKAAYFFPDGTEDIRWKYFSETEGYYDFGKEAAERLLKFEYVCFGGCVINMEAWKFVMDRLERSGLHINYSLDILVTLFLFEKGGVYYSPKVLAKVRIENDTRDSRLPYMIEDAAYIFNFMEKDGRMNKMISDTSLDLAAFKKRFFLLQSKALYYPYFENHFDFKSLKRGFENLKKFEVESPAYFSFLEKGILMFPGFGKGVYKVARPLLLKMFKK